MPIIALEKFVADAMICESQFKESMPTIAVEKFVADAMQESPHRKPTYYDFFRYTALNVYRRLFSIVFLVNLSIFIAIMVKDRSLLVFVNATAANLTVCGLVRQPLVVNCIYRVVCSVPRSAPLRLRRIAAKAFHLGGVHSGCGVASFVWYIGLVVLVSIQYYHPDSNGEGSVQIPIAVVVLAYAILALLLSIIVVAYPAFRFKSHDHFELTHRFSGWLVVILFVALLLTFANDARHAEGLSLGQYVIRLPAFWLLLVVIAAIVHPYLLLRRVRVRPESLSKHAIRLHMNHTTTTFGKGIQLSKHPLRDWHSFATFPDLPTGDSFSCLVSKAGDWTADTINNPPTHLWKRGTLLYGFAYVMRMFSRIIVVTTGSGIGPCLSFIGDSNRPAMRVVWQTRSPLKTYGQGVLDLVKEMDPDPLVLDTDKTGRRVDMVSVVEQLAREFDAEAICVISNPKVTKELVFTLESRGLVAMGPIFDS
ncbi:integral membrane protein TmpA [Talaromyces proteolyticus]|uniref:Integral membrane protein TmpA n=1 Tax=Talaromyces proteolyticus TaxID=1131652 RepID=A0AAD4KMC9_9EURO|nr:integral membrane protein TmpA [Talaromyces proteolyticus]KAH8695265.1 integral membrane protein TmpA [Talaromyces proteolyticus]